MFSFFNQLLAIDVTARKFERQALANDLLQRTLGGKGLATRLLLQHNPPGVDPLSQENHLILAAGPLAGTAIWGSCRYGVYTKSPQTGYFSESYSGGTVGEYMAKTGYDAVMIKGASPAPIWIEIGDAGAFIHAADDLWGLESYATEDRVKAWLQANRPSAKKSGVVCIGPAGENLVRFAVIENDYWRSAGRTGVGTVLGAKKIKAIAFWGAQDKALADAEQIRDFAREFAKTHKDSPGVQAYKTKGTPMMVDLTSAVGSFPTRYWHKGQAAHQDQINATAFHERLAVVPHACLRCFMACGRLSTVKEGRHQGLKIEGPEYETIGAFGGLCEVDRIEEIAYLNDVCDRLGLDTITAGNLVAFAIEAARQGKIDYQIDYNQVDKIAQTLEDIAYRRGIGDALAEGIRSVAKSWGMEDQAIHVKGMEPAAFDPRVLKGMTLSYGTSARGACHLRATFYKPELAKMIDPEQIEGKAEMFAEWEDRLAIFDTLILCRFYRDLYQWEQLATVIAAATGVDLDTAGLRSIATDVINGTRRFNLREGLTPQEDRLPPRFCTEALPETGKVVTEQQMEVLLREYYQARGWDAQGRPHGSGAR
ncbi:MAG: aldehyde ferredoxin oxidoreductase family protein [Desulfobacterales bacterium]|nr:MAG: aldehyde ferredoxin oxidoreductase family protein [Desulfobacterales bacterium]